MESQSKVHIALQDLAHYEKHIAQIVEDVKHNNQRTIQKIVKSCTQLLQSNKFSPQQTILSLRLLRDLMPLQNESLERSMVSELLPYVKRVAAFRLETDEHGAPRLHYWGDHSESLIETSRNFQQLALECVYGWAHLVKKPRSAEFRNAYLELRGRGVAFAPEFVYFTPKAV